LKIAQQNSKLEVRMKDPGAYNGAVQHRELKMSDRSITQEVPAYVGQF